MPRPRRDTAPWTRQATLRRAGAAGRLLSVYPLLTIAYAVSGGLGMLLAVPPGYASPIFPPAGIAMAAMLIWGRSTWEPAATFMRALRRAELELRKVESARVDAWTRVVAGARLAEGFTGEEADWLLRVARGSALHPG